MKYIGSVGIFVSIALKSQTINKVVLIDVDLIVPNPSQPRVIFNEENIKGLSESITENGLLQPLTIRRYPDYFELVSGERRLRALKYAGVKLAPCIIVDTTDKQSAVFALLENLQREDLNYFEEAVAIKNLIVEWNVSQQEIGMKLGKAQPTIANKLRLLRFSPEIQALLLQNGINERQARSLLKINDDEQLKEIIETIVKKKLNVAQTEQYIDELLDTDKPKKKTYPLIRDVRIFINTINNAIKIMNKSGIGVVSQKKETNDYIEYIVKIPTKH